MLNERTNVILDGYSGRRMTTANTALRPPPAASACACANASVPHTSHHRPPQSTSPHNNHWTACSLTQHCSFLSYDLICVIFHLQFVPTSALPPVHLPGERPRRTLPGRYSPSGGEGRCGGVALACRNLNLNQHQHLKPKKPDACGHLQSSIILETTSSL